MGVAQRQKSRYMTSAGLNRKILTTDSQSQCHFGREVFGVIFKELTTSQAGQWNSLKIIRKTSLHDGMGNSVEKVQFVIMVLKVNFFNILQATLSQYEDIRNIALIVIKFE